MKKSLCVVALCAVALAVPFEALAKTDMKDVLTDVGVTIIKESIKNSGTSGKKTPEETPAPREKAEPATKLSGSYILMITWKLWLPTSLMRCGCLAEIWMAQSCISRLPWGNQTIRLSVYHSTWLSIQ